MQSSLQFAPIAGRTFGGKCLFLKKSRRNRRPAASYSERETLVRMRQVFSAANSPEAIYLKNESADKNVSRGQMSDKIVAISGEFY
jgi:hypothetical protein